jgi:hypothetical protein
MRVNQSGNDLFCALIDIVISPRNLHAFEVSNHNPLDLIECDFIAGAHLAIVLILRPSRAARALFVSELS